MAEVAVFHASIMAGGGAESVGVHALQAIQDSHHDVTLYTVDDVDVEKLNDRHGTRLNADLSIRQPTPLRQKAVDAFTAGAATMTGITDLPLLRRAVVERTVARKLGREHDVVVSTDGPFAAPGPVVQYVHFPYYDEAAMRRFDTRFSESLYPTYHRVCRTLRPRARGRHGGAVTLTNSRWTADVMARTSGRSPEVLNPPVRTDEFDPPAWNRMEDGFVCVGRVHPLKRQHVAIEIVDGLHDRGIETHLHLVGSCGSEAYCERIRELTAERPYVHLEGVVPRARLVELVERHRFGIHARRFEHFGIAVAEMAAGETIPFVHDSGGQTGIVPDSGSLAFSSVDDAVEKIAELVTSPELRSELRDRLREAVAHFDHERFQRGVVEYVDSTLAGATDNR